MDSDTRGLESVVEKMPPSLFSIFNPRVKLSTAHPPVLTRDPPVSTGTTSVAAVIAIVMVFLSLYPLIKFKNSKNKTVNILTAVSSAVLAYSYFVIARGGGYTPVSDYFWQTASRAVRPEFYYR